MTTPLTGASLAAIEARANAASPAPWVVKQDLYMPDESVHYAIHTRDCQPAHPHSPRFIFFACGSLGQATAARWRDYQARLATGEQTEWRHDPEIAADVEFAAHAREDVPALVTEVRRLHGRLRAIVQYARERDALPLLAETVTPLSDRLTWFCPECGTAEPTCDADACCATCGIDCLVMSKDGAR